MDNGTDGCIEKKVDQMEHRFLQNLEGTKEIQDGNLIFNEVMEFTLEQDKDNNASYYFDG